MKKIGEQLTAELVKSLDIEVYQANPPHRWALPWLSKQLLAMRRASNEFTHFMYTEDDLLFTEINRIYFEEHVSYLKTFKLYPSFFRIERLSPEHPWISTDIEPAHHKKFKLLDKLVIPEGPTGFSYINAPNPYQAMFLYDEQLLDEHLSCKSANIHEYGGLENINDEWGGGVAERAAFALTYFRVPQYAASRNVLAFDPNLRLLDSRSFIHHLPNNYANRKNYYPIDRLFDE